MDGALNPKTSLLIKIAKALDSVTLIDPEVSEWLDRMAELKFIRQEYMKRNQRRPHEKIRYGTSLPS